MNVGTNYTEALEAAKQAAEAAKQAAEAARAKAETAKTAMEKESAEAEKANAEVDTANANVASQQSKYTQAGAKLDVKQSELQNALAALNTANAGEDETAIANAQQRVDAIEAEIAEIEKEVQAEYEALLKAQQDAETAIKRAEIEQKEADTSLQELETAETELAEAEEALVAAEEELAKAEEALATAEAEAVALKNEVEQLTEEEAIAQGYTVIKTVEELQAICNDLGGKYILMGDIDLSGINWNPIGEYDPTLDDPWAKAFSGEFNGNGYSIKNLEAKGDGTETAIGLFGATNGATISNVKLEDIDVGVDQLEYSKTAVGGLIGLSRDTDIDNVAVSGDITGHQGVGGLIGVVQNSGAFDNNKITNVTTDVNVDACFYAGGLIGKVKDTAHNTLTLENCHTAGTADITDLCAGGLIGEAGKTVVTVNKCSSSMDITKEPEEDLGLSWLLDDTSRIGGIIGNCNGTYISVCNSDFTGKLTCDDEFKGDVYGWYMNDAQVSIFELSAGLPADDILNIEGIEGITPVVDPKTGKSTYNVTVSTLAGMNRMVDMIQNNPKLAEVMTFNVQFDFESMDLAYDKSLYAQYGVVQLLYEDEKGNVVNEVYIDNEVDLETTFNVGWGHCEQKEVPPPLPEPEKTMVEGLYKDGGKYYIKTGDPNGSEKFPGFTEVSLEFFFANQSTIVKKRLDTDEVKLRDAMVQKVYDYQAQIQDILKERFGVDVNSVAPTMDPPEYKALYKKQQKGIELTEEEKLQLAVFELNYTIMNIVGEITRNEGCGMGGNASFLERNDGVPLEDEYGQVRYQNLEGLELRLKVDENGETVVDKDGNPMFITVDGEDYLGGGDVYIVRGFPVTDENNNMLYTDAEGKTVVRKDNEDGTKTFEYEDGTAYEGAEEELTQQLEEDSPSNMYANLEEQLENLKNMYEEGGGVDPSKENNGVPQTQNDTEAQNTPATEETSPELEKEKEEEPEV